MADFIIAYWMPVSLGLIGALFAEGAKQYQKWCQMDAATFLAQFRSVKFWLLVLVAIAAGGITAGFLHDDSNGTVQAMSYFVAGAGTLALIRNGASVVVARIRPARNSGHGPIELTWYKLLS